MSSERPGGHPFCPHCGHNFVPDDIVERDGWRIDPRALDVHYNGRRLALGRVQVLVLHAVARSSGAVTLNAIINRIGSEAEDPINVARVYISKLRTDLPKQGAPFPIRNVRGIGYAWAAGE